MELKIGDRIIDKYNQVTVSLRYDSVASAFSFLVYFDPADPQDRKTFIPGNYLPATITHKGETLITGVALSTGFGSSSVKELTRIGGYSKGGVLEDCQRNPQFTSGMFNNMSLTEIAQRLVFPFGLDVVIDDIVKSECNTVYPQQTMESDQNVKEFLTKLSIGKNIVFSHDVKGNLLFTRANTTKAPIYDFDEYNPNATWTRITLSFDGQQMHDSIIVVGQSIPGRSNACDSSVINPYVQHSALWNSNPLNKTYGTINNVYGKRPKVSIQTSGNDNNTPQTARQLLAQELKAGIKLTIEIPSWTLNGTFVRPNNIVTVTSPENFLYQSTRWFIESVDYRGDEKSETATLNCVLPECYNNDNVINVFTGSNLTVPYRETGAHAIITPIDQNEVL